MPGISRRTFSAAALAGLACTLQLWWNSSLFFSYSEVLWPPSNKSAPALLTLVVSFVILVQQIFFRPGESAESRRVREVKKRLLLAQMVEALKWDYKTDAIKDVATNNKEEAEEEEEKKKPPTAKELFEMVFDDIEERHVTEYGIQATGEPYRSVLVLFKERLAADFQRAVKYTTLARELADLGDERSDLGAEDAKCITEFRDGSKLSDLLDLYNKKIRKHFGKKILSAELLRAAQVCHAVTSLEQRKGVRMLWPIFKPLLPIYMLSVVLMTFDSLTGNALWNGMATLLDGIADGTMTLEELKVVSVVNYVKFLFCIFSHLGSRAFTGKVTSQFRCKVRSEIMRSLVRQDTAFFDIIPSGVLQERLNKDAEELAEKAFDMPLTLIHFSCMMLTNAYTMYAIKPEIFLLICIPMPLISLAQYFVIKFMNRMKSRQIKIGEHSAASTMEVLKEIRTVREFAMETEEAENFAANACYRSEIEEFSTAVNNILFIAPLLCMFVATRLGSTYLCGAYVAVKNLTVGQAIQIGFAAEHLQHFVRELMFMTPTIIKVLNPLARVCDMLATKPKIEPLPDAPPKLKPESFQGHIEFKDVDFTFPSEPNKQILHKLSFTVLPGQKVAFVGSTGCGKSTSIKLIERFYNQSSGTISLDGLPIGAYDVHHLRQHMSVVAQDNVLFSTTLRENIIYGLPRERRETISDAEVEEACRRANAWAFVNDFPRKLETYAGERGVKLSGGQKQRLAIARAIIRKPTIVLLDEATSALDSKAEGVVQAALDKMIEAKQTGCTIMIAHRLATVKKCDKIIVMDKGSVVEEGSHEELLEIPIVKKEDGSMLTGWYNDLWTTQMGTAVSDEPLSEAVIAPGRLVYLEKRVKELEDEVLRLRGLGGPSQRHKLGHAVRADCVPEIIPYKRFISDRGSDKKSVTLLEAPAPVRYDRTLSGL
mmetsp:Transcript_92953/g.199349  ORF Transcript_92953/g.199349 Transcript_92953/m.199349 type:complete len:938 (-) Transcript_92953:380-3193(-)